MKYPVNQVSELVKEEEFPDYEEAKACYISFANEAARMNADNFGKDRYVALTPFSIA